MRKVTIVALLLAGCASTKSKSVEMTGQKEHAMANCPSATKGATTTVANIPDGVQLTVTAPGTVEQQEIRRRAQKQLAVGLSEQRGAIEHTGEGTGSGKFGYCPGMIQDTVVSVDELPDGARITVRANQPSAIPRLQKDTAQRAEALRVRQCRSSRPSTARARRAGSGTPRSSARSA